MVSKNVQVLSSSSSSWTVPDPDRVRNPIGNKQIVLKSEDVISFFSKNGRPVRFISNPKGQVVIGPAVSHESLGNNSQSFLRYDIESDTMIHGSIRFGSAKEVAFKNAAGVRFEEFKKDPSILFSPLCKSLIDSKLVDGSWRFDQDFVSSDEKRVADWVMATHTDLSDEDAEKGQSSMNKRLSNDAASVVRSGNSAKDLFANRFKNPSAWFYRYAESKKF